MAAHRNNRPWVGETVDGQARKVPEYVADCPSVRREHPGQRRPESRLLRRLRVRQRHALRRAQGAARPAAARGHLPQSRPAEGIARVVCYTPRHDMTLAELEVEQVVALLSTWQEQYRDLGCPARGQSRSDVREQG